MAKYSQQRKAFGKAIGEVRRLGGGVFWMERRAIPVLLCVASTPTRPKTVSNVMNTHLPYASLRLYRQFGQIQKMVAESYAQYMASKSYIYNTSNSLDLSSTGNVMDSDGVKLFAGKMAKDVADSAIQVMGGNGYTGEYRVEQLWRDAKLLEIGGGTNESHHKNMTKGFGKGGGALL